MKENGARAAVVTISCFYCCSTAGPFHDDHVVPRSRGGPDSPTNLVKACRDCNFAKRDLLPSEWLAEVPERVAEIEQRISKQIGDKIRGRRNWKRRTSAEPRQRGAECYFCGGEIRDAVDGFLTFYDQESGPPYKGKPLVRFISHGGREECGALAYPGNGRALTEAWHGYGGVAVIGHTGCGPDIGYWINFEQLLRDGTVHWAQHLSRKASWDHMPICDGLKFGLGAALRCSLLRGQRIDHAELEKRRAESDAKSVNL